MTKRILQMMMALGGIAVMAAAQQKQAPPPTATAPKTKGLSANEAKAVRKVMDAKTADEKIAAVDALMAGFPDIDNSYKVWAYDQAAEVSDLANKEADAEHYGELAYTADPSRFDDMLLVAGEYAKHTRKNDLDRDQKLNKARDLVKKALEIIPTAAKPADAKVSDKDWENFKKDQTALAHTDLGLIATAMGNAKEAAAEFQNAADMASEPDQVLLVRLAHADNDAGKYAEAEALAKKIQTMENLNPQVKAIADQELARAQKAQQGGAK